MKLIIKGILAFICVLPFSAVIANTGNLFNVTTSGANLPQIVSFTLCLHANGKYPLTCQNYTTSKTTLSINTIAPNKTYHYAGIKINSPGYEYVPQGINNFKLNKNITVASSYTLIGRVSDTHAATGVIADNGAVALSLSVANLALSVSGLTLNGLNSGTPRRITVTNTSGSVATGFSINYPTWPTGTTATSNCGTVLDAGAQCTITITPGAVPTSECSATGIAPTPGVITVRATQATAVSTNVVILNYGCIYQGGYIFAMTETPNAGESIGGKVVSQEDLAPRSPNGIIWSSNGAGSAAVNVSYDMIPGIGNASTPASSVPTYATARAAYNATYANENRFPFPSAEAFSSCNGITDGACNTANILALYNATYGGDIYIKTNYNAACDPTQGGIGGCILSEGPTENSYYAAGLCQANINGYSDWYLPAICEMGPAFVDEDAGCQPGTQNIFNQLPGLVSDFVVNPPEVSCPYGANCLAGSYWSSTLDPTFPQFFAWFQYYNTVFGNFQSNTPKNSRLALRCVRAMTT